MNFFTQQAKYLVKILFSILHLLILECDFDKKAKLNFILPLPNSFVGATIVESSGSTDLFEGTTSDPYTIVLNSPPSSSVTIAVNFDTRQLIVNDSTTSPIGITFTPDNWNIPQTVTVRAVFDNITEGNHKSVISHDTASGNLISPVIGVGNVVANITDNQGSRLTSSFQSGTITSAGINPINIALTSTVDASKSFVYCNAQYGNSSANRVITCQLADTGSEVIIQAGAANAGTVVNWYVVEFSRGALVQRGGNTMLATESSNTITLSNSVDLSRTFIIANSRINSGSNNSDERRTLRYRMLSTNSFEVYRNETGTSVSYEWQVIQLDGGRVQSGQNTIASGSNSISATISSVTLNNSFIIFNLAAGSGVNGAETDYYVRASYSSATQVTFTRTGNSDTVDISWFAIEMVDGTTSQSGNTSVASTDVFATANLNSVDSSKTMIISSYQVETGDSASATQDSGTYSSIFTNSTTIQFDRAVQENNAANISWFAVQFQ